MSVAHEGSDGFDEEPADLVRPYALVRRRNASTTARLPVETTLATTARGRSAVAERRVRELLELCTSSPLSLIEVAGRLDLPLGVVRMMAAEQIETGNLDVANPDPEIGEGVVQDLALLRKVLEHVQRL